MFIIGTALAATAATAATVNIIIPLIAAAVGGAATGAAGAGGIAYLVSKNKRKKRNREQTLEALREEQNERDKDQYKALDDTVNGLGEHIQAIQNLQAETNQSIQHSSQTLSEEAKAARSINQLLEQTATLLNQLAQDAKPAPFLKEIQTHLNHLSQTHQALSSSHQELQAVLEALKSAKSYYEQTQKTSPKNQEAERLISMIQTLKTTLAQQIDDNKALARENTQLRRRVQSIEPKEGSMPENPPPSQRRFG